LLTVYSLQFYAMNYTSTIIKDQESLEKLQLFLMANKLPASDLKIEQAVFVGYYDSADKLVGSGGVEFYGKTALLRSIAVDEKFRGQQLGKTIVEDIITKAKDAKINELYLLTETAHTYFLKKGFQDVSREVVPDIIRQTTEFAEVCPASAVVMKLTL
jgi:amino-acid N-acetyltransferase